MVAGVIEQHFMAQCQTVTGVQPGDDSGHFTQGDGFGLNKAGGKAASEFSCPQQGAHAEPDYMAVF